MTIEWSSSRVCMDTRPCFARDDKSQQCGILKKAPAKDGMCSFCKPVISITNGIEYPYNPYYGTNQEEINK